MTREQVLLAVALRAEQLRADGTHETPLSCLHRPTQFVQINHLEQEYGSQILSTQFTAERGVGGGEGTIKIFRRDKVRSNNAACHPFTSIDSYCRFIFRIRNYRKMHKT